MINPCTSFSFDNASFQDLINKPIEEQEYIRERLLRYCELDTYAMVKIYEKILEVVKETKWKKK